MKVLIIGNGIAGTTAARTIRKLDSKAAISIVSSESDLFFSRTALMYIYMGDMRYQDTVPYSAEFWAKNRINLHRDHITHIDFRQRKAFANDRQYVYDVLILATGSKPRFQGWKGQHLQGVQGLYSLQDLDLLYKNTKNAQQTAIFGGGLIGIELAEMLLSQNKTVSLYIREASYWANVLPPEESEMVSRQISKHRINLVCNAELEELIGDDADRVGEEADIIDPNTHNKDAIAPKKASKVVGFRLKNDATLYATDFVGITTGVEPNVLGFATSIAKIPSLSATEVAASSNRGYLVDNFLETAIKNVYAIGDCAELRTPQPERKSTEAVWYTGSMMGETVAHTICGKPTEYVPRLWYNSAKFLDIEYQTYGTVAAILPAHLDTLYWEHEGGERSVRINFEREGANAVVGFTVMGIRYRHEVCERWILMKTPLAEVVQHLGLANFDPEFYAQYEAQVAAAYTQKFGKPLALKTRRGLDAVLAFLGSKTRST
jgi:3-phenylpropionate/trans-cinnamate dioxygenase ferredoxin reductase component